ncbi:MAG: hypothetical protein ABI778_04415 [Ignavibacteriota bacterium]
MEVTYAKGGIVLSGIGCTPCQERANERSEKMSKPFCPLGYDIGKQCTGKVTAFSDEEANDACKQCGLRIVIYKNDHKSNVHLGIFNSEIIFRAIV